MLTDKQTRFVNEYLVDLNATQAAIRAGYSRDTAHSIGHENLTKPKIVEAIAEVQAERSARTAVTSDQVLREMAWLAFSDIRRVFGPTGGLLPPDSWDDATAATVSSIKVVVRPNGPVGENGEREVEHVHEIKFWDKNSALEKLCKHLGMFRDRLELTGKDGGPIKTADVSDRTTLARAVALLFAEADPRREETLA